MKINQRGQSALEYLMTYGWALVVIVIVVAALVLLVGNPQSGDNCSQAGTGFSLSNQNLVAAVANANTWEIVMSNITGRSITLESADNSLDSAPTWSPSAGTAGVDDITINTVAINTNNVTITPGQQVTLRIQAPSTNTIANTRYSTNFKLTYNDGQFDRNVSLNCSGTA